MKSVLNFSLFPKRKTIANIPLIGNDVEMDNATYENTLPFSPEIKTGKVVRVYDGDTITIATRISVDDNEIPKIFRFNVRLLGIDTPELKTKNQTEKLLAVKARDALNKYIIHKMVTLQNTSYDKYGRILADVIMEDGTNISDWMLENSHAVEYDGGTKHRPMEWTDSTENVI